MGIFDSVPVLNDVEDAAGTAVTGAIDAPADVAHAFQDGLDGEFNPDEGNMGWVGTIPSQFDDEAGGGAGDVAAGGVADWVFERPNEGANFWFGGIGADANSDDPVGTDGMDLPGPSTTEAANDTIEWTGEAAGGAANTLLSGLWSSTGGKVLVALVVVYVLGQLVDFEAGGADG